MKTYVAHTHYKRFGEAILMSTHNIYFHGEITKTDYFKTELSTLSLSDTLTDIHFI